MTPAPISVDGAPAKVHRYGPRTTPNLKTGRVDYDGMAAFPNGNYVLHSDFAALLHQLAEFERIARVNRDGFEKFERLYYLEQDRAEAAESKLAERDAEVERLRTQHSRMVAEAAESYSKATAAERAREGAKRIVMASEAMAVCAMSVDGYSRDELVRFAENLKADAAAFLAASGGKTDG